MITLYIEPYKIEEFALFDEDLPHWNKIIKSGINLCLNISDDELDKKLTDDMDPLYLAYNGSGTMKLPMGLDDYIQNVKENPSLCIDKPNSIFVLDVKNSKAIDIQKRMGIAFYASENLPEKIFSKSFFIEFDKNQNIINGWKGVINFEKPLSNSFVITDNYFFSNDDNRINRGANNLIYFADAYLPDELEVEYQITIVASNNKQKPNNWWVKEYGKLVSSLKNLREYPINIELVLAESPIHKRRILSNYVISKSDKGFDIFISNNPNRVKQDNDFEHLEIFSNLDNLGTKHFQSAEKLIIQLSKHCNDIADYVAVNKNQTDRSIFGCNDDKTIKNRLLN